MDPLIFNSVEIIPGIEGKSIFKVDSSTVFKEDADFFKYFVELIHKVPKS